MQFLFKIFASNHMDMEETENLDKYPARNRTFCSVKSLRPLFSKFYINCKRQKWEEVDKLIY